MIPYGYCQCGCGRKNNLSNWNDKRYGSMKGEPRKYLNGHSTKVPVANRFWSGVKIKGLDDCWEWIGNRHKQGYGLIGDSGKTLKTHRVSWELANGPIPNGLCVLHKCDNPSCCNPAHLFIGTQDDNMKDCKSKGRIAANPQPGETNPMSKLTEVQVLEMRNIRSKTGLSHRKIAVLFGVATMTAYRAIEGKLWRHI